MKETHALQKEQAKNLLYEEKQIAFCNKQVLATIYIAGGGTSDKFLSFCFESVRALRQEFSNKALLIQLMETISYITPKHFTIDAWLYDNCAFKIFHFVAKRRCALYFLNLTQHHALDKESHVCQCRGKFHHPMSFEVPKTQSSINKPIFKAHRRLTVHRSSKLRRNSADVNKNI
jgi:hypothetical protein